MRPLRSRGPLFARRSRASLPLRTALRRTKGADRPEAEPSLPKPIKVALEKWLFQQNLPIGDSRCYSIASPAARPEPARDDLCEEPAAQLARKLLRGIADDLRQRMRKNKRLSLTPVLLQLKRQIERAAETESVPAHARGIRQGHVGKALEQHRQQDVADSSP
jgi:hypothetical protein